ncbi:MAG: hypothetical protein MUF40_02490 [Gemmatimonadaceae bacterium]|jgi:hypothetical protein|nr:hypothetical protein [Gemmatimonadaceae bacterium]
MRSVLVLAALVCTACSQSGKKPRIPNERVVGTWRSDTLPAADAAGRVHELRIAASGRADWDVTYLGKGTIVERGTWDGADSLVRVVVRRDGVGARSSLLFVLRDSALVLRPDTANGQAVEVRLLRR